MYCLMFGLRVAPNTRSFDQGDAAEGSGRTLRESPTFHVLNVSTGPMAIPDFKDQNLRVNTIIPMTF